MIGGRERCKVMIIEKLVLYILYRSYERNCITCKARKFVNCIKSYQKHTLYKGSLGALHVNEWHKTRLPSSQLFKKSSVTNVSRHK